MLDIVQIKDGLDLGLASSDIPKAANVLAVQLGELEYVPDFGVDKRYFLTNGIQFQKASFKAYCIQRLVENQINVTEVVSFVYALFERNSYRIGKTDVRGFIR